MQQRGTVFITIICAALAFTSIGRATHVTNHLYALQSEVTNRLAMAGTNTTKVERRSLSSAARALARNTTKLSGDVAALAAAINTLSKAFSTDATLIDFETNAVSVYSGEAQLVLYTLESLAGTNALPRGTSNQLAQARELLNHADAATNSPLARARELVKAFKKLDSAGKRVHRLYQPQVPILLTGSDITLYENANVNEQTVFYFHTMLQTGEEYYSYESHNPEELGTWTYERKSKTNALFHCSPNWPPGYSTPHDMALAFTSPNTGTFTGTNSSGRGLYGVFVVTH